MILATIAALAYSYYRFDRLIIPLALQAAELRIQTDINLVINNAIQEIIDSRNLTAADFIVQHSTDNIGLALSVNTLLVNDICNAAAMLISDRLNNMEPITISVPMGMAFELDTLANVGPRFNFQLAPIGNAIVDFGSRFSAVGINQTHFSVCLTVESEVRIINPVHSDTIFMSRHVSLVDAIFAGEVPETYLSVEAPVDLFRRTD